MALLVGGVIILNPAIQDQSYAYTSNGEGSAGNGTPDTTPSLELAFTGATDMQAIAEADRVVTMSNTFTVKATNVVGGYYVAVQAANGLSGNLIGRENPTAALTGVGDKVDTRAFALNTWGYAMTDNTGAKDDNLVYSTLPAGGATLTPDYSSGKSDEEKTFKLAFAAKFGHDLPTDHYETSVMVSAVANTSEVVGGFKNIARMQDMTQELCAATPDGYAKQLQDTRDNKWYWVTKLKDGNCWMTQNLDYDLPSDRAEIAEWPTSGTPSNYYDPGDYVYTAVSGSSTSSCETTTDLEACKDKGWTKLTSDQYPSRVSDFSATPTATEYNAHYHVGNYYTWTAAVENNAGGENVQGVCPPATGSTKWILPTSEPDNYSKNGSFYNLLSKYGLTSQLTGTGEDQLRYTIHSNPLYFVYGGYLDHISPKDETPTGILEGAGWASCSWSSTPDPDSQLLYFLAVYDGNVDPYMSFDLSYGMSVRCLYKAN